MASVSCYSFGESYKFGELLRGFGMAVSDRFGGEEIEVSCQCPSCVGQGYGIYITEKYIKGTGENMTIVAREFAVQISNSRAHLSKRSYVTKFVNFHMLWQETFYFY